MAYRIQYGQSTHMEKVYKSMKRKSKSVGVWITVITILLSFSLLCKMNFFEFMIPGDNTVTKAAFSSMVEDLKDGAGMESAFTAFCREILDGAQLPY